MCIGIDGSKYRADRNRCARFSLIQDRDKCPTANIYIIPFDKAWFSFLTMSSLRALSKEGHAAMSLRGGQTDRWILIQQNTFTNWVNEQLRLYNNELVEDLQVDFPDGVRLCYLVESLQGKKIGRIIKKPNNPHQNLENVTKALNAIANDNVRLVNIGSDDIVTGNLKLILGLVWHLILRYQIGKTKFPTKKLMLAWVQAVIPECGISNFTTDWNDGIALNALVDFCKPGLSPDWRHLSRSSGLDNCQVAMQLAKDHFDIPLVVRPEDFASPDLDELSGMTYLSYFMKIDSPGYFATLKIIQNLLQYGTCNNFTSDWQDGHLLANLVKSLGETVPPLTGSHQENIQKGMDAAARLGVQPILTAKEICDPEVDHIGIMAYAAYFRNFKPSKIPAERVVLSSQPKNVYVGQEGKFSVRIDDDSVSPKDVRAEIKGPDSSPSVRLNWTGSIGDGLFYPEETGIHRLNVFCNNQLILGCPLSFKVMADRSRVTFTPVDSCPVGMTTELKMTKNQKMPVDLYKENFSQKKASDHLENGSWNDNDYHSILKSIHSDHQSILNSIREKKNSSERKRICKKVLLAIAFIVLVGVMAGYSGFAWHQISTNRQTDAELVEKLRKLPNSPGIMQTLLGESSGGQNINSYLNIGMRTDYKLQECKDSQFKLTFPDVDYALLGYNILKGYPLAIGHDPGFTIPIFIANYSGNTQTADCRYSVPHGFVIMPDISCVTSFSSKIVQTKYEFSKSLSVSANVAGGGWGVKFSASAGYKESSSQISTGESVFIISSAKCMYYFSKIAMDDLPKFSESFRKWIFRLDSTDAKETYVEFFELFGTHFATYVKFGSRFTYEHKMNSRTYQSKRENGVNVAVQASYSGLFSVGGGFNMDSSQQSAASEFSKSVETKTITIGAPPPANGDAMTWASTVQDNPVPMEYEMESIETLFSTKYMHNLGVNFTKIAQNIEKYKFDYCQYLRNKGKLDSCDELTPGIVLERTQLLGWYKSVVLTFADCVDYCLQEINCQAVSFCKECNTELQACNMFKNEESFIRAGTNNNKEWTSVIFTTKILKVLKFEKTDVVGISRESAAAQNLPTDEKCKEHCILDAHCVAYSYCACADKNIKCRLFGQNRIEGLKQESNTNTYFIYRQSATDAVEITTGMPFKTTTA